MTCEDLLARWQDGARKNLLYQDLMSGMRERNDLPRTDAVTVALVCAAMFGSCKACEVPTYPMASVTKAHFLALANEVADVVFGPELPAET